MKIESTYLFSPNSFEYMLDQRASLMRTRDCFPRVFCLDPANRATRQSADTRKTGPIAKSNPFVNGFMMVGFDGVMQDRELWNFPG